MGYTTATTYNKTERMYQETGDYQWRKGTIDNILVSKVYTGVLVQGVKSQNLSLGKKQEVLPMEEWIIVEDAHEAIVSKEDFETVQQQRMSRKQKRELVKEEKQLHSKQKSITGVDPENRYKNLLFEKETEFQIPRRAENSGKIHIKVRYVFDNNRMDGQIVEYPKIRLKEETLDGILLKLIREALQNISDVEEFKKKIEQECEKQLLILQKKKKSLHEILGKKRKSMQKMYERYVKAEVRKSEYLVVQNTLRGDIEEIEEQILQKDKKEKELEYQKQEWMEWIELLYSASKEVRLSRELLLKLVERIEVGENNHLDIRFKFAPLKIDGLGGDWFGE